ncbi:TIGR03936 family radical SAM-associated protein [Anaeroselena agilis]|uniref:TIGR03936 family radical SAM-associated protein n=1 Tax=Anaeroselena agilis TaxID=3063788 RepID=A0ABU3NZP4_9FIRM|nr:TIGR03936 family radical SAM-associated protein [Selenomonadales bacterium 4137-cl]
MSAKYRLEITKGEEVRYVSHLDYMRSIERAVRRSKLPAAYSEGFNPHMKIAFASALSVGVASEAEYMDIELTHELDPAAMGEALARHLPPGIAVRRLRPVSARHAALMAVVNLAAYRISLPLPAAAAGPAREAVSRFNAAAAVPYIKENPKGKREIDVKTYVSEVSATATADGMELALAVRITPTGSIKPAEVLKVLVDNFALPADPDAALVTRTGLFVADGTSRISPLDI